MAWWCALHSERVSIYGPRYHYRATGAVQTTLNDGTELYQRPGSTSEAPFLATRFNDGQTERHSLDGSKEIRALVS